MSARVIPGHFAGRRRRPSGSSCGPAFIVTGDAPVSAGGALPAVVLVAGSSPCVTSAWLNGPGGGIARRELPASGAGRFRRGRRMVSTVASAVIVAAIFGLALPHFASYRSVWASVQMMTWLQVLLVVMAAAGSLRSEERRG